MKIFSKIILTIFSVSTLCFFIIRSVPGDASLMLTSYNTSKDDIEKIRENLGINKNVFFQYKDWLLNCFKFDFGKSYYDSETALQKVVDRIPITLSIIIPPFIISVFLSITISLLCLIKPWGIFDQIVLMFIGIFSSLTTFLINIALSLFFSVYLKILPLFDNLIVPITTLVLFSLPNLIKVLRNSLLEESQKNYVLFLYMLGLPRWRIYLFNVLPNSLSVFLPVLSLVLGNLLSVSVVIDKGFSLSGLSSLMLDSILNKDYNVSQLCIMILSVIYIIPYFLIKRN